MADNPEQVMTCDTCGASIYPEHLDKHVAERVDNRLLCKHCLDEQSSQNEGVIVLDDVLDRPTAKAATSQIHYTAGSMAGGATAHQYRRPLQPEAGYAIRCKTFHCKLTDASMTHLDDMVNEWADADDDVRIKFATSTVGIVEGKHLDPHLIVTVFY
jgi:hypothetical protein